MLLPDSGVCQESEQGFLERIVVESDPCLEELAPVAVAAFDAEHDPKGASKVG